MAETTSSFRVEMVGESAIQNSPDSLVREQAWYAGPGSIAYACIDGDRIVGICFYWFGERYLKRNSWPIGGGEAKLVQIISLPEIRGRGVATLLVTASFHDMVQKGYLRAYARIWHSNIPSLRVFERAGWKRTGLLLEINPLRRNRPICIRFNLKASAL